MVPHYTKAKRGACAVPDRLHHRRLDAVRQVNPLVAPGVWEGRGPAPPPSRAGDGPAEFWATYDLVVNAGPRATALPRHGPAAACRARHGGFAEYDSRRILSELQKLCIVLRMRATDRTHLDFVYSPTHCER